MAVEYLTVEHLTTKDLIRIFSKVEINPEISWNGTPCWIWKAGRHGDYGAVRGPAPESRYERIHRLIFAWLVHPLPRERARQLDHLCKRKLCCNPVHLEFVTARINSLRADGVAAANARKTHCSRGHSFSRIRIVNGKPERYCNTCARLQTRKQYQANPEKYRKYQREWRLRNINLVRERDREAKRKIRQKAIA